jgi:hypothetical protein
MPAVYFLRQKKPLPPYPEEEASLFSVISTNGRNLSFAFLFPDITEFALRKSRVEAYKNLSAFQLKDFSLNTRFLANYVVG